MKKAKNSDGGGGGSVGEVCGGEEVTLRRRESGPLPIFSPSPYTFMRRSCTFVAESSLGLRKSVNRTSISSQSSHRPTANNATAANKVVKDRKNLAMQVRQKKELLEESVDGKHDSQVSVNGAGGRMSRLVGGLRAWNSTEDVRQSFMGAMRPVTRRVKQAFGRPDPNKPETITANGTARPGLSKAGTAKTPANRYGASKVETNRQTTQLNNARNAPLKSRNQLKTVPEKYPFEKTSKTAKGGYVSSKTPLGRNKSTSTSHGHLKEKNTTSTG
ncbi:hypothetical protein SK128_017390, partial [Halocaridina rubra]